MNTVKQYHELVGKAFVKKGSGVASRVADTYLNIKAREGNFDKIQHFLSAYKALNDIFEMSTDQRKVFVAAMIRLYNPQLYHVPDDCMTVIYGFAGALSRAVACDQGNISRLIRQVVFEEKVYSDFRERVDKAVNDLYS